MSLQRGPALLSALSLGLTSLISQILLLREMVVVAGGNEICLGLMLSTWLMWVGIGSWAGGIVASRSSAIAIPLHHGYGLLGLAVPASLLMVRSSRFLFGVPWGQVLPLSQILLLSFLLSLPLCLVLGGLFVLTARHFSSPALGIAQGISSIYLGEAVGAFLGGLLTTLLLLPYLSHFQISFLLLFLNLLVGLVLWRRSRKHLLASVSLLSLLLLLLFALRLPSLLDRRAWQWHWKGMELVTTADTVYGNLSLLRRGGQITLFASGLPLFSYPDPEAAEEAVHYALLQHPHPRSLLLVGGGVGGGLREALKYPDLKIEYAELDPQVISLASSFIPSEAEVLQSPQVEVRPGDALRLLRRTDRRYDVIIVNSPDPSTLQLNRFYTREFFQMVKRRLHPGGIFSFRLSSSEDYLSPERSLYLATMRRTVRSVFAQVVLFPGPKCIFFATSRPGTLQGDASGLIRRLRERGLQNLYVNSYLLPFRLHPTKISYLNRRLEAEPARINRDLEPVCHLLESSLWASQFGPGEKRLVSWLHRAPWTWGFLLLLLPLLLLVGAQAVRGSFPAGAILGSVFAGGWTSISLEIGALLCLQIYLGFVYRKMGLLLSSFMLGLGLGAWWGRRKQGSEGWLLICQATLVGLCLLFLSTLSGGPLELASASPSAIESFLFLFLLAVGMTGGMQFCLANDFFLRYRTRSSWGTPYAVDLLGSALGALLFSAFLIPRWGIVPSIWMLTALDSLALIFLCFAHGTGRVQEDLGRNISNSKETRDRR
jgi:spermidine synthase